MRGPTTFKVSESLGPVGWLAKEPIDYREFHLDFKRWLAPTEAIVSVSQYAVATNPKLPAKGCWTPAYQCCPNPCDPCGDGDGPVVAPYSIDGSTIIELANVPQTLFAGVTPPRGFEIANPNPSFLDDIWVSDTGPAAVNGVSSWRVAGNGGTYVTPDDYQPIGPVSVIAERAGLYVTARMWGGGVLPGDDDPPVDANPLHVALATVVGGTRAVLMVGGGTAGMTYGLSVLAVAEPTQRRKAIDILFCVGKPMVDIQLPTPPPPPPFQYVDGGVVNLPVNTIGDIFVRNQTTAGVLIRLPPLPNVNDELTIKDIVGNADDYNILVQPATGSGVSIDGQNFYSIAFRFGALRVKWTGTRWNIL